MALRNGEARAAGPRTLYGYILREFALSFAVAFLFFFVVFGCTYNRWICYKNLL